jgi:hypothetical protein
MIQDHEGVALQVRQTAVLRDADGKASTPTRRSIGTWPGSRKTAPLLCSLCPVFNVRASLAASTTRAISVSAMWRHSLIGRSQSRAMAVFRYVLQRDVAGRLAEAGARAARPTIGQLLHRW